MKSRIWIPALLILAAIAIVGCEEKTKYITTAEVPAVPVGVYSVTGDGYVDVIWQANNDRGNTDGYGVYRYTGTVGGSDEYALLGTVDASPLAETYSFRDSDVQNGETYYYAVNAFNDYGESELSDPDAFDTPRPDGAFAVDLTDEDLNRIGWDFSAARTRVWSSVDADVFFEYDSQLDAFFLWSNRDDVYLQDYGYTDLLNDVNWGEPGGGWDNVGWMELSFGHAYIVAIGDVDQDDISENYGVIRVTGLDLGQQRVSFQWAYQTSEFNPELKQVPVSGKFPSAIKHLARSGN